MKHTKTTTGPLEVCEFEDGSVHLFLLGKRGSFASVQTNAKEGTVGLVLGQQHGKSPWHAFAVSLNESGEAVIQATRGNEVETMSVFDLLKAARMILQESHTG